MAKYDKVDYSKSMIYKLCCKDVNIKEIYVGSTTNLIKRKYQHKADCYNKNRKSYNYYVYKFIRSNGGFDNFDMVLIENYACNNKQELHKRERYYIELLGANLNTYKPFTTEEEKKEQHKQQNKKYQKDYRENNKDKIKHHYENNKEQINEKVKQYQEKNKDKIKDYQKNYREKQKQKKLNLENLKLYFNILRQK